MIPQFGRISLHLPSIRPVLIGLFLTVLTTSACQSSPEKKPPQRPATESSPIGFLVMGDMPYNAAKSAKFPARNFEPALLEHVFPQLVDPRNHRFLLHLGDIKGGSEPCTNQLIEKNLKLIQNIYPNHTFYTPGDNEWTDCDRQPGVSELERLRFLKSLLAKRQPFQPQVVQDLGIESQRGQSENQRWHIDRVWFFTLHVPGTNMARIKIKNDPTEAAHAWADQRDRLNLQWLEQSFATAQQNQAEAIVVALHADIISGIKPKWRGKICTGGKYKKCDPYLSLRQRLIELSQQFARPVLLAHGDTGGYCLDQPLPQQRNFWRLNAPGDYRVADMADVTVDVSDLENPFQVRGSLVTLPAPKSCQPE